MLTVVVAVAFGQGAVPVMVYVTVYVPAVLVDGVIAPVLLLIVNPAGLAV